MCHLRRGAAAARLDSHRSPKMIVTLRIVTSYYVLAGGGAAVCNASSCLSPLSSRLARTSPSSGDETSVAKWGQRHAGFCCKSSVLLPCRYCAASARYRDVEPSATALLLRQSSCLCSYYRIHLPLYYVWYVPWFSS